MLKKSYISRPDQTVLDTISLKFSNQMMSVGSVNAALELYITAKLLPETSTRCHVMEELHVSINGAAYHDNPRLLSATTTPGGKPCIVKILKIR